MLEKGIRRIARDVVRDELANLRTDRHDGPVTAVQVGLVHAWRSAAGFSPDELPIVLGERWGRFRYTGRLRHLAGPEWLRPSAAAYARQRAPLPSAYVVPGGSGACVRLSMPRRAPASPRVTPRDPTGSALGRRARRIAARPHQLIRQLLPSHSAHVGTQCPPAARARAFDEPS
jgi:hypothetical protein